MRQLINNLIFRTLVIMIIPGQLFAQLNEKFYTVSDEGEFQYTYWESLEGPKNAVHPVTIRTFFLEGKRNGVIPQDMSYQEFQKLSTEDIQAIITFSQQDIIAAMNQKQENSFQLSKDMFADNTTKEPAEKELLNYINKSELGALNNETLFSNPEILNQESATEVPAEETEDQYDPELPWIVQALTKPGNYEVPVSQARVPNNTGYDTPNNTPWIVQALIDHEELVTTEEDSKNANPSKSTLKQDRYNQDKTSMEKLYVEVTSDEGKVQRLLINAKINGNATRKQLLAELNKQTNNNIAQNENIDREFSPEEGHIRAMVYNLVRGLITQTDDEISEKYGKVFPGIDGMLYGTSDLELDQIVKTLLTMKDEILVSNDKYDRLFDELEAWASAR